MSPRVQILLATYNGQRYLPTLLDSLFSQSHQDFEILAADDGSSDRTLEILCGYAVEHPGQLRVMEFPSRAGGARANFARLIEAATAPYAMFCDQDDVWLAGKIEASLVHLQMSEARYGTETPILVHSDLVVTDAALRPLSPSFRRYSRLRPSRRQFRHLLLQNNVVGCSCAFNRAQYSLARPVPDQAVMHDQWFAIVAAAFGQIVPVHKSLTLYRRHEANDSVVLPWRFEFTPCRIRRWWGGESMRALSLQARAFSRRYADKLTVEQVAIADAVADLWGWTMTRRIAAIWKYRLFKDGLIRNIGLHLFVALYRTKTMPREEHLP